jgi:hypothetical protein
MQQKHGKLRKNLNRSLATCSYIPVSNSQLKERKKKAKFSPAALGTVFFFQKPLYFTTNFFCTQLLTKNATVPSQTELEQKKNCTHTDSAQEPSQQSRLRPLSAQQHQLPEPTVVQQLAVAVKVWGCDVLRCDVHVEFSGGVGRVAELFVCMSVRLGEGGGRRADV